MIQITRHSRGLSITAPHGVDKVPSLIALTSMLADRATVSGTRVIAGIDAAADVLLAVPEDEAHWDTDILQIAQRQRDQRAAQQRARLEVAGALECPETSLGDYAKSSRLDRHQLEAAAAIAAPSLRGISLFDEQGTGKTISTLAGFEVLRARGDVERLLVIAPKSVLASWAGECSAFLDAGVRVATASGTAAQRRRFLLAPHDVLLVSYDVAARETTLLKTVLNARKGRYLLVVDESYMVKNPEAVRSQAVLALRPFCARAVVLCGTPAPNRPFDIVNQVDIADEGATFSGSRPSKDAPADEVATLLKGAVYLRRLKRDVLPTLPDKLIEKTYVPLAPEQQKMYDAMRTDLMMEVRSVDDREFAHRLTHFLTRRVRLLQICSHPGGLDPLYAEVPAKLRALDRLSEDLVGAQGKKVVVWSFYRASIEAIVSRYQALGVVRIDGTVSSIDERIRAINEFQKNPGIRMFVGNAAAAGAGITLTAAHHAIYESLSNQAAHYMQSVDRIHRRGQTDEVISHVLIAKNTIESSEFDRLLGKERAGRSLLGDQISDPITRERFLEALGEPSER
ncbi:MAG TPA: DEAD/DEAH box helicase [Verrucomicrobiae bacterium]|nr:DEAD/DEAH box helicase [Verrucomicrobiae bacterium]